MMLRMLSMRFLDPQESDFNSSLLVFDKLDHHLQLSGIVGILVEVYIFYFPLEWVFYSLEAFEQALFVVDGSCFKH